MPKIKLEDLQLGILDPDSFGIPKDGISLFTTTDADGLYIKVPGDSGHEKLVTETELNTAIEEASIDGKIGSGLEIVDGMYCLDSTYLEYLKEKTWTTPSIVAFALYEGGSDASFSGTYEHGYPVEFSNIKIYHYEKNIANIVGKLEVYKVTPSGNTLLGYIDASETATYAQIIDVSNSAVKEFVLDTSTTTGTYGIMLKMYYTTYGGSTSSATSSKTFTIKDRIFYGKATSTLSDITELTKVFSGTSFTFSPETSGTHYIWFGYWASNDKHSSKTYKNASTNMQINFTTDPVELTYETEYGTELTYHLYRSESLVNSVVTVNVS